MIHFQEYDGEIVVTTDSRAVLEMLERCGQVTDINVTETQSEFHVQALVAVGRG